MPDLHTLTATEAAKRIGAGTLTSEALTASCLERITAREPQVHAWIHLDPKYALEQARTLDRGPRKGALHGIPLGVKDIIDTADMPTGYGSAIYVGHRPAWDAACVAQVRDAGAVIMGKTVTSEFAGYHVGPTLNPHDPARTPGISSMGSAAATADMHVPIAFGSQTGGSIIRPAAFCGSIGYKPSFGTFNRTGVHALVDSLDHLGHFARSVEDIALLGQVLTGRRDFGAGDLPRAPRIGFCRSPQWEKAQPEIKKAVEDAAAVLKKAGAEVVDAELPAPCAGLNEACITFIRYEGARTFAYEYRDRRGGMSAPLKAMVDAGLAMSYDTYAAARALAETCRALVATMFKDKNLDVLVTPSAECEAPLLANAIGDSVFNRLWTLLHVPALAMTTGKSPRGLPVGIQIIGPMHGDSGFLQAARWIEQRLT
jgi:Asp-tRNA(Asn)/Glu-tRNA(Gln) amidotransferase A subunit family amidase